LAKIHPIVIIVWDDAHGTATKDVTENELPHKPVTMTTLGWLLREDEAGVSVACERYSEDLVDYYRGHTFIPHAMVKSVTRVVWEKAPRKPRVPKVIPVYLPDAVPVMLSSTDARPEVKPGD
jgi:hypothetical protein